MEIANGYSELNDPDEQHARFEEQAQMGRAGDAEAHPIDDDYVNALGYGMPPTGGLGVGIDRVVMLLTGATSIREVVLFPAMRDRRPVATDVRVSSRNTRGPHATGKTTRETAPGCHDSVPGTETCTCLHGPRNPAFLAAVSPARCSPCARRA